MCSLCKLPIFLCSSNSLLFIRSQPTCPTFATLLTFTFPSFFFSLSFPPPPWDYYYCLPILLESPSFDESLEDKDWRIGLPIMIDEELFTWSPTYTHTITKSSPTSRLVKEHPLFVFLFFFPPALIFKF